MRTAYLATELLGESAAPASQKVRGLLRKHWDAFKERRERARVKAILYGMQDRELKDLGSARCEIESVMVDGSGERTRAYPMPNRSRG
jgi:uncharacterized protein YjiS (DUF1127 family)